MLYLHSLPVQVWQRQNGNWIAYTFNASIINDISTLDRIRTVTIDLGDTVQTQGYSPRINDILIPVADTVGVPEHPFQYWGTRINQPYYYEGVNSIWTTRPGILFLTAFNDGGTYEFSDFFSLPEFDLVAAGTHKVTEVMNQITVNIWNRLTGNHPLLPQTDMAHAMVATAYPTTATVTYDSVTEVHLNEFTPQYAAAIGGGKAGGAFTLLVDGKSYLGWFSTMELGNTTLDLRQEDILQLEVRSREAQDSPNLVLAHNKDSISIRGVWYDENGVLQYSVPPHNTTWTWRVKYEEVDDNTNHDQLAQKAREDLTSSPRLSQIDLSIVLDMTNRYSVTYDTDQQASWSLPVPGSLINLYGYDDGAIQIPVREYDFATGKLLLGTNNDITLKGGH